MAQFRFAWVVAASGAIVMALEILSARILSPTFGSSVYVWGSIISVFLAALALGYLAGGRLADRAPKLSTLGRLLLIAALFQVALLLFGVAATEKLGNLFGTTRYGALAATAFLFGPITTLLATVSPFSVRLAAREVSTLGNVAGRLYALSTAGSLVGTLGCTFVLIPFLELEQALLFLIALTVVTILAAMAGEGRQGRVTSIIAVGLLAGTVIVGTSGQTPSDVGYRRMTPYQTLELIDRDGRRSLRSDGRLHSAITISSGEAAVPYVRHAIIALVFNPELRRTAVLGLGSGSFGQYLEMHVPGIQIDSVEIDPAVVEVAEEYFGFEVRDGSSIHVQDARRFLNDQSRHDAQRYDLIFSDTYLGLSVPFHLTTVEFFELLSDRLTPDGILMINVAASLEHPFSRALFSTVGSIFDHTYLFYAAPSQNHLVVATKRNLPRLSKTELERRASELQQRFPYEEPSLRDVASRLAEVDMEIRNDQILRDAFAPVDHLVHLGEDLVDH